MAGIHLGTGGGTHFSSIVGCRTANASHWGTHLAFYTHNNDASYLNTATEKMRIDGAGRVTTPNQPSFEAYLGSQWTLTNGATVPFGSTSYNTGSGYNTSNYRFTAPVAGKYLFYIHTYTSVANGDIRALHFQFGKNGNSNFRDLTHGGYTNDGGYSYHPAIVGTVIMNLAANDYVYIYFNGGGYSGGNVSLAATSTYWGGYLLG